MCFFIATASKPYSSYSPYSQLASAKFFIFLLCGKSYRKDPETRKPGNPEIWKAGRLEGWKAGSRKAYRVN